MDNNLWINITKPDEDQPLIDRRYFDSFAIKTEKTQPVQTPDIIKVPEIHATAGDSGVVSTAVYNNISPPNEGAQKAKNKRSRRARH